MKRGNRPDNVNYIGLVISVAGIFLIILAVAAGIIQDGDYSAAYKDAKDIDYLLECTDREMMNMYETLGKLKGLTDEIKADPARLQAVAAVFGSMYENFSVQELNQRISALNALKQYLDDNLISDE